MPVANGLAVPKTLKHLACATHACAGYTACSLLLPEPTMTKRSAHLAAMLLACASIPGLPARDAYAGGLETAGRKIDHAARRTGEGLRRGTEKTLEGIEQGVHYAGEGIRKGAHHTEQGIRKGMEKTGEGLERAGAKLQRFAG